MRTSAWRTPLPALVGSRYTRPLEEVVSRIAKSWGSKLGRVGWHMMAHMVFWHFGSTNYWCSGQQDVFEISDPWPHIQIMDVRGAQGWTPCFRARTRTRRTFCWKATLLRCCHGPDLEGCAWRKSNGRDSGHRRHCDESVCVYIYIYTIIHTVYTHTHRPRKYDSCFCASECKGLFSSEKNISDSYKVRFRHIEFDLIFIDGNHAYEDIIALIVAANGSMVICLGIQYQGTQKWMVVPASDPVFLINTQMSTRGGWGTTWKRLQLQNFSHARQWNSTCCCACRWPQRTHWGRYSGGGFAWNTKNLIYSDHHCCTSRLCWELAYLYNSLHLNRSQHFATREDTLVLLNHVFTDMTEACLFDLKIQVWLQGEKPIAIHHLSKIEFWNHVI